MPSNSSSSPAKKKKQIRDQLELVNAECESAKLDAAASGIAAIYFNFEAFAPLGRTPGFIESSKKAARLLITSIEAANHSP